MITKVKHALAAELIVLASIFPAFGSILVFVLALYALVTHWND